MKKNLLKLTFILSVLLLTLIPLSVSAISGNGTEESPFMITNQDELELVTDFPDCHFKLANDIVMTKVLAFPLCYESENQTFTGVFDGNGYTISNLEINNDAFTLPEIAIFANNNGIIKNLNFTDSTIYGAECAGITLNNSGSILNCSISGVIGGGPGSSYGIARYNNGTISECTTSCNLRGAAYSFGVAENNSGTISKCTVDAYFSGAVSVGVVGFNKGIIEECEFIGTVSTGWSTEDFYGICEINGRYIYNEDAVISKCKVICDVEPEDTAEAFGICQTNYATIKDCYVIGSLKADFVGGITYQNGTFGWSGNEEFITYGKIENCYVASEFKNTTETYPIATTEDGLNGIVLNCFYDRTLSGINDNTQGTSKSTTAMKIQQTYQNWDFDTVWGIDENINDGYPYLLWEYPVIEKENPYTINSLTITDLSGNALSEIPDSNFYLEIDVTKNDNSSNADSLIIAVYDENGAFLNLNFMKATYTQNQSVTFGTMINKPNKKIGSIKAFVWDSLFTAKPLSNAMEIN